MQNIIERMDRLRTGFLWFVLFVAGFYGGYWILYRSFWLLFLPDHGQGSISDQARRLERFRHFIDWSVRANKVVLLIGLIALGTIIASWFFYKKRLTRNPEISAAVRDERVRLIWLLACRKAILVFIPVQFAIWLAEDLFGFFTVRFPIIAVSLPAFFVYVMLCLGTFLSLDRRSGVADEDDENSSLFLTTLTSIECVFSRRALLAFGLYSGWNALFLIGRIHVNWRSLSRSRGIHLASPIGFFDNFRGTVLVWDALLLFLFYFFFLRSRVRRGIRAESVPHEDERTHLNWLKACRFSFIISLVWQLSSPTLIAIFVFFWGDPLPYNLTMLINQLAILLAGAHLTLFLAVASLLGSFIYYSRQD